MFPTDNPATAQLRWHSPLLVGVRLVVGASLVLMLYLFTRLPVEDLTSAVERFSDRNSAIQQLDRSFEAALRARAAGQEPAASESVALFDGRRAALARASCAVPAQAAADAASLDALGKLAIASPVAGAGQEPADGRLLRGRERIRELQSGAENCLRLEVDDIATLSVRIRRGALVLIGLIALGVLGVVILRRNDQRQLREQLRFSEQLIDAIPLPLSMRSPDGRFLLVNRAFEQRHKVRREHLIGQPVSDTLPRRDADAIAMMDARAAASLEAVDATFDFDEPGGPRHVQVRVLALRRLDRSVIGVIGIQTDVTALRRKEAQLTETNARLGQLSVRMLHAQEDERRRIARDLHDEVGQILTALKMQLASLARGPDLQAPAAAMVVPIDLAEEALRHTRDLSASLHPHLLDDLGVEAALSGLIDRFIRPSLPGIELRCRLVPARGSPAAELVAFRVVQEALTNVVRHAGATRAGVILDAQDGTLSIEVIDDGVGFEAGDSWLDLQRTASLGVTSMRDRVAELGGELQLQSGAGAGTSLRARLPW